MRIVLAVDGSPSAAAATELVGRSRWPDRTRVDICGVIDIATVLPTNLALMPAIYDPQPYLAATEAAVDFLLESAADRVRGSGPAAEAVRLSGRPADAIALHAAEVGADLIVCGSRGRGTLSTMLLGSVSAELADRAHCPVLVARNEIVSRVLLAHDGSGPALLAERIVAAWPLFEGLSVHVVGVRPAIERRSDAFSALTTSSVIEGYEQMMTDLGRHHTKVVEEAAARLRKVGRDAGPEMLEGDAAARIVEASERIGADLVVIGTRGLTGIDRLLLGSVARNVLLHSSASVLVVRPSRTLSVAAVAPQDGAKS